MALGFSLLLFKGSHLDLGLLLLPSDQATLLNTAAGLRLNHRLALQVCGLGFAKLCCIAASF
jgi:hypothetical protein